MLVEQLIRMTDSPKSTRSGLRSRSLISRLVRSMELMRARVFTTTPVLLSCGIAAR